MACKLDLGTRLKGVHNVFHISLLRPYRTGGDGVSPPEPIVVDGTAEFEVERILAHRDHRGRAREYLVRWAGHDSSEDLWLMEADLQNAPAVLHRYKATVLHHEAGWACHRVPDVANSVQTLTPFWCGEVLAARAQWSAGH